MYKVLFSRSKSVVREVAAIKVLAISQSLHEILQPLPEGKFPSAFSISKMARVKMSLTACKTSNRVTNESCMKNTNLHILVLNLAFIKFETLAEK